MQKKEKIIKNEKNMFWANENRKSFGYSTKTTMN